MPPKFNPSASPFRQPITPNVQTPNSRHSSIVEMLSTPPSIDVNSPTILTSQEQDLNKDYLSLHNDNGQNNENLPHTPDLARNASQSSTSSINTSSTSQTNVFIRDWQDIKLIELVESAKLIFIDSKISVEEAFNTLQTNNLTSLPVLEDLNDKTNLNCLTFDYTDLNSYLLLVLGRLSINEQTFEKNPYYKDPNEVTSLIQKATRGEQVPVKFVTQLVPKNPFYKLSENENLSSVVEILGTGVHRIAIVDPNFTHITGILSQRRLMKYFWDNARRFPSLEPLFQSTLEELNIGSRNVISIQGDEPLINALSIMSRDKISSIAVVDNHLNLFGNISVTDVKHVTKSSQSSLLHKSCFHFVSVILNLRGLEDGQDSFPIFHVYENSSLVRTVAKLVATRSHRLWVVRPYASSTTSTQTSGPNSAEGSKPSIHEGKPGKLVGVVSLTDIINVIARKHGKTYVDPQQARKQRRRSSSGSVVSNGSLEQFRRSISGASDLR
ncbi:hypothetical protein WICMUC_002552 [Wickerhamomyces mucosus]|uniref:CBS domain-containing protein n=1 Tax=Wickerhamomyces mucosus TaxID=1378264 RepID=A0A9P8TEH2_9ASCO|nr:hypothetical protein WICMUC_002552 [Wickerhamomyces mucosus]